VTLKKRYAEHRILLGPALTFGLLCPEVPKAFGLSEEIRKKYKIQGQAILTNGIPKPLRMAVTSQGEVGFDCHSTECLRTRCKLNARNPT